MTAGNEYLDNLNHSGEKHERDRDHRGPTPIPKAKGDAGQKKDREVLESCGAPVSGRNQGGTTDNTVMTAANSQAVI